MENCRKYALRLCALMVAAFVCCCLCSCGGSSGSSSSGKTSGAAFSAKTSITSASYSADAAYTSNGASIDTSSLEQGYVAASATSSAKLKFQVVCGDAALNYDLPSDGTPIVCPLSFGDGSYTFRVMQNTSGNNYVELASVDATVSMDSEFEPFLRPNVYCNYSDSSACVAKARELVANAENEADALKAICTYIIENISYDTDKASQLQNATGYVPDPDETLASGSGICFDYACLGAAMLRSQGIPARIVTGYVSPNNVYHAWIMVYVDGAWQSAQFTVNSKTWSRVDLTFAAGGSGQNVGDGKSYTDRYVY